MAYSDSRSLTYGPIAEGMVGVHSSGDFVHVGHIGTGGRFVVLGGFYSATRSPLLDFLIR